MSEEMFRWVITAGVAIATLCIVVQAIVMIVVLRVATTMQAKVSPLIEQAKPLIAKLDRVAAETPAFIERLQGMMAEAKPFIGKMLELFVEVRPVLAKVVEVLELRNLSSLRSITSWARPIPSWCMQVRSLRTCVPRSR